MTNYIFLIFVQLSIIQNNFQFPTAALGNTHWLNSLAKKVTIPQFSLDHDHLLSISFYERSFVSSNITFNEKDISNDDLLFQSMHYQMECMKYSILILSIFITFLLAVVVYQFLLIKRQRMNLDSKEDKNEQLQLLWKELILRNKDLRKENQSKDFIFSVISHDIKGTLASMQSGLQLINEKEISAEDKETCIQLLNGRAVSISNTVNNLLVWSRGQLKGVQTNPLKVNLYQLVQEQLEYLKPLSDEKDLVYNHNQTENNWIWVDQDQIVIVIRNILNNAIKFSHAGSTIDIQYEVNANEILMKIIDSGKGISKEKLEQIKTTYGDEITTSGTNNESGTGLGLKISRDYIHENNGELEIYSEENQGTRIEISLPRVS